MNSVADYGFIAEGKSTTLDTKAPGDFQELTFTVQSPPLDDHGAILAFNMDLVDADGLAFNIRVNGSQVFDAHYTGDGYFAMTSLLHAGLLHQTGNRLQFKATSSDAGKVKFSNLVIFYQRKV